MPRISTYGPSNDGYEDQPVEEGDQPSAGISSLTSEEAQDKSGSTPQVTVSSVQSPAPETESPSEQDHPAAQQTRSSATTAGGHTRATGRSQRSRQVSSEGSEEPADTPEPSGKTSKGKKV